MKKFALAVFAFFLLTTSAAWAAATTIYPQLDISGFKKWEYKKADVSPSRNYFSGLTYLGGYYPTFTGGPWQERLQLRILGQLSDNLSVGYDLEQQPETPDKFDVKVKYNNTELTFGDLNATFSGNEFISTSKYLNGVMLTAKDSWYDIIAVPSSKLKSQTQALTSQKGNNTRGPYNLGHGSIIEGSEQIKLNDLPLKRNIDYTIDYFEGKVSFNRILNLTDEFKYSYEYSNILDLFFPALSKRDFFGFQSRFTIDPELFGRPPAKEETITSPARDIFPTVGTLEPDILEEETSGRYRLHNFPVEKMSENLSFMGTQLKKNEDYIIRYDIGEIKLLTRFLPTTQEALTIDYMYYQTSLETEVLAGIGSRGPYRLKHQQIVPESERIEVDDKYFVRDLDYSINYTTGEILFGVVIGPTSQVKVGYAYNIMTKQSVNLSKFPKELKLGFTYLKETAKKGTGAPTTTAMESCTGQNLISGNYLINLKNRPVLPTTEASFTIWLKHGSTSWQLTQEVDYTIPTIEVDSATGYTRVIPDVPLAYITDRTDRTDGYGTGTIYFYNHNISASDEISVTYTYKKSIVNKYNGVGDGSKGPYYLRNTVSLVPGSETVQVWDQGSSVITTYTRNTSFEGIAGDTGYAINYTSDNPSITFNNELSTNKNFQIIYQYIAPQTQVNSDIAQSAFGVDGSFKIGNVFKIDTTLARSESDQVFVSETTIESFVGNGGKAYVLHAPGDIIEGSELISVNLRAANKDIDYYVNYTKPGQFTFYYISPTTQDAISVQYKYQSPSGSSILQGTKSDTAARLGAETRLFGDALIINGNAKKIGFDFSPLGGTAIGVGSEYNDYNVKFNPNVQGFGLNYAYKFNKNPLGNSRLTFLRSYDNTLSTSLNPNGVAKIDLNYRNYNTLDDPLNAGALHNNDNFQESLSGSLVPSVWQSGVLAFTQKYDFSTTTSKTDVVDRGAAYSTSTINFLHGGAGLKLTERLNLDFDYQQNNPTTINSLEVETAHNLAADRSYGATLDLTTGFLKKWLARVSVQDHDEQKTLPTPESHLSTKNQTYHMDLTPFDILTGSYDHNRQEKLSLVSGMENPMSQRTTGTARLTPFGWLGMGLNITRNEAIPETGSANKTYGRNNAYDLDFIPISIAVLKLATRFTKSDAYQTAPLGKETVRTDTDFFNQNYTLNLNFLPMLPFTFGLIQEDYNNINNSITSPVTTETSNQTITGNATFTPFPRLSLSADFNQKTTSDLVMKVSRPKQVVNGKVSYQVLSWGTLLYDYSVERNKGEVQAGSVANLNFKKTTQTISLNITIPVDNPVLTNFNLLASLKTVQYANYNNSLDNFTASLMSFEGTMNF